jgi:hypothetical protein
MTNLKIWTMDKGFTSATDAEIREAYAELPGCDEPAPVKKVACVHWFEELDCKLQQLTHRLDHFTPLLSGDHDALETVVACLQCNEGEAGEAYDDLNHRLNALEYPAPANAAPTPFEHDDCRVECHPDCPHNSRGRCSYDGEYHGKSAPETKSETLYAKVDYQIKNTDAWGPAAHAWYTQQFYAPATLAQVEAEFVRMGGKVQTETNPRHVAFMSKLFEHTGYAIGPEVRFRIIARLLKTYQDESFLASGLATWLLSLAAELKDDPAAPCKGTYGEEHGY